ncbi:MAG: hypothetical protein ACYCUM_08365 [Solirubrobacteraceae bacterium]
MATNRRRRMARRYTRRAKLAGEEGVTIAFGYSSLMAAVIGGVLEELPYVGIVLALLFFRFHRTVLVTDRRVYVFRDLPFHRPGARLGEYPLGPDTVTRVRGKLTFPDGQVAWHSPLFAWRVRQVAQAVQAGGAAPPSAPPLA